MMAPEANLLGCPVTDCTTGRLLGRVAAVVLAPMSEGGARIAVEPPAEPFEAAPSIDVGGLEALEPIMASDYMLGQFAAEELRAPEGSVIVRVGEVITVTALEGARRAGLLHRLVASFTPPPRA